ncbi:MAG: MBL fold metallo-hydrolase [Sphingobacteriales bacterium]|nr:MBL fold metallo-hydrolase [Sphingobacteriales bacterium]
MFMIKQQWRTPPNSDHYSNGKFRNLSPTPTLSKDSSMIRVLLERVNRPRAAIPAVPLPTIKTNLPHLFSDAPAIVWFGHSSYLIVCKGVRILVDPVFSGHAAPMPGLVTAFKGSDIYTANDFPAIDYLIITHNHYDHLDKKTLASLLPKIKKIYTSLGVGKDIVRCAGNDLPPITEMDWWETEQLQQSISLTATPARHFSGRGLVQATSLWSSFVLDIYGHRIFIGGDSGYDTHFKLIGEKFGPFDLALLECGQYNLAWHNIHLLPEETAQAAVDLKAKVLMPVHWAKFALANHPWNEPPRRLTVKAKELGLRVTTPLIGQAVIMHQFYPNESWWED